jgi:hypothetical protein
MDYENVSELIYSRYFSELDMDEIYEILDFFGYVVHDPEGGGRIQARAGITAETQNVKTASFTYALIEEMLGRAGIQILQKAEHLSRLSAADAARDLIRKTWRYAVYIETPERDIPAVIQVYEGLAHIERADVDHPDLPVERQAAIKAALHATGGLLTYLSRNYEKMPRVDKVSTILNQAVAESVAFEPALV